MKCHLSNIYRMTKRLLENNSLLLSYETTENHQTGYKCAEHNSVPLKFVLDNILS